MISYDLAKELKDAGWEQPNWLQAPLLPGRVIYAKPGNWEDGAYAPSLSELIAACPREIDGNLFMLGAWGDGWVATYCIGAFVGTPDGVTPEEAVARLWLALRRAK